MREIAARSNLSKTAMALTLGIVAFGAACGDTNFGSGAAGTNPMSSGDGGAAALSELDGAASAAPIVVSTTPIGGKSGVALDQSLSATFSVPMAQASLSTMTFTLGSSTAPVAGAVVYANATATFFPSARLAANSVYIATITSGATSAHGAPLGASYSWSFTTGAAADSPLPVNLGTAADYAILSKAGIFTATASTITGNIGVSPAAATYITGFSLSADSSNVFSTSTQVTGKVYAADYLAPTPSNLTTATAAIDDAFTDAATRSPKTSGLGAGNIGGLTLVPGVYEWGTDLTVPTDVTLSGNATDVWIFQVAQSLSITSNANVVLSGGALAKNVFWQVAGTVNLGTNSTCEGTILAQEAVTLQSGASLRGRILAKTSVSLAGNTVIED